MDMDVYGCSKKAINAREFLYNNFKAESEEYFGIKEEKWLSHVWDAWLNDESNSAHRYNTMTSVISKEKLKKSLMLDMSSGCGTFMKNPEIFFDILNMAFGSCLKRAGLK